MVVDPGQVGCHSGIDARKIGMTTALSPAHHSYLEPGAPPVTDQGASRVTLQGKETCGSILRVPTDRSEGQRPWSGSLTWQESRPLLPAHSMSSLINFLTLWYCCLHNSSATIGTSTSCRW